MFPGVDLGVCWARFGPIRLQSKRLGLREFKIDNYNYAVDMDQAAQNGALVLYASNAGGASTRTFGLLRVDSLLDVRWTKPLADNNTIRLSSIKRINDNTYILSGNYAAGSTSGFYLSEIDSSGNLIWMNAYKEFRAQLPDIVRVCRYAL